MKVLHFIWSANFGGIEKLVINLARQQLLNPHLNVSLLIGNRKGKFLSVIENYQLPVEFADLKTGLDFSLRKYNKVLQLMKAFDIIHIHTFNPVIVQAAIQSGKKIIFTVHGNFGFGRKRSIGNFILQRWCGYFIRHYVDYVTYNSEFSQRYAAKFYRLHSEIKEALIYNAIPENEMKSVKVENHEFPKQENQFVIGTASRFAGFKRIDRLIEAFRIFCSNKPDTRLLLVGDGVKMEEYKQLVSRSGIERHVTFTGYRENVYSWLNSMDVCVFPSENEPFGIVALEALRLGKPVLVFADGGGLTEIIRPLNQNNIAGNVAQLVERLSFYYQNRTALEDEKSANSQYAQRFNITDMEQAYFKVYSHVLNNS
ncbi:MAG: glycosyltransferase [Bacteroidia bacterium]|nr:glycosyltransferase [Bacteroidia bacterium]